MNNQPDAAAYNAKHYPYQYRRAVGREPTRDLPLFQDGRETKRESFQKLLEEGMEHRMYDVLCAIEKIGPCTDQDIAKQLGIDVCSVTRPRGDLLATGYIVFFDKVYNESTGRRRSRWRIL